MDRLVGILRSEDALTARLVRQNIRVDFSDSAAVEQVFQDTAGDWYEFVDCPLTLLRPGLFPKQAALLKAWDALSSVAVPDTDSIRLVLTETVLGLPTQSSSFETVPARSDAVKPTAAHPRAYLGTKYKPPKPKAAEAHDWRPVLCDPRRLGELTVDAAAEAAAEARLPELFRSSLFPLVRGQCARDIAELLALYWAMSLDSNADRLAAAAYLFSLQCDQNARGWCRLILTQLPSHWTGLVHLLIASGADTADFQKLPPSFGAILSEVLSGKDPFYRAYWLFAGIADQVDPKYQIDPEYLLAGYRLADTLNQSHRFHTVRRGGDCPIPTLLRWGEHCREADDFYAGTLLSFWEECGLRPGLGKCLEQTDLAALIPNAAWRWLKLLRGSWDNWSDLPEAEAEAKWEAVHPLMNEMTALVQNVPPEYQDKCVRHLTEYLWQCDTPSELKTHLPSAFILVNRLSRPPFADKNDPEEAIADFLTNLSSSLRERFLSAPDKSFKRLEQACRRHNDAALIGLGIETLSRHQADFSVCCFEGEPERLFHAAKLLGTLTAPMRDDVVRTYEASAEETLRAGLTRLEQAALETLAAGFAPDARGTTDKHALQMQQGSRDNRRALRKFLAAHWNGQTDYRQTHPLTRRWLAAHPNLDLATWQSGIVSRAESETWGTMTLTVEQDPVEALKCGTYVGSCLGLGGAFSYSAAAVVLDINKQVVYARDQRGTVVGRQLLAISEADQLVCYEVYPLNAQQELGQAFAEFDRQFASALKLLIYSREKTEGYDIAHILSHEWWDDHAWDLAVDSET